MIDLKLYADTDSIISYKKIVENAVKDLEPVTFQTSIEIAGDYKGDLTLKEKNSIVNRMLKNLDARTVQEHRQDELFVVSAYTGLVPEYILQEGRKVNIDIRMEYDEVIDKTSVVLCTPINNNVY